MPGNDDVKVAAAAGITATIAATWAALKSGKVSTGELPQEVIELLIAIAQSTDELRGTARDILAALGISGGGWPANANSVTALRVAINPATGVQLPAVYVPSGMALLIKAWALNPAWLWVGATAAEVNNINQAFPLLPSEVVTYQVENADQIFVAAMTPLGLATLGCFACLTVEQRKGGG